MDSRLCLVTGANAGLGRATAARLVEGGAQVLMVCRDEMRGQAAKEEIMSLSKGGKVDLMIADLSLMASVRSLAADIETRYPRLDVLINNAAVFLDNRMVTAEGSEQMFATNYLGPFLLTRLLLPRLEAGKPSRIINVTAPSTTKPVLDDLQGERKFSPLNAFGASKAAQLLFTYALARRLQNRGVTVNAYHPGIVKTSLNRTAPGGARILGGLANAIVGASPEAASEGLVQLATSDQFIGTSGKLIHKGKEISAPFSNDTDTQDRLWEASCHLLKIEEAI